MRTDVVAVTSAQMITADMVPDVSGTWLSHAGRHVGAVSGAGSLTHCIGREATAPIQACHLERRPPQRPESKDLRLFFGGRTSASRCLRV
jgi:hypothetical protein